MMDPQKDAQESLDRSRVLFHYMMHNAQHIRRNKRLHCWMLDALDCYRRRIALYKSRLAEMDREAATEDRFMAIRGAEVTEGMNGQMTMLCAVKEA